MPGACNWIFFVTFNLMENKRCIQIFLGLESIILGYMALIPSKLSEEYVLHFIPLCSGLALNLRTAITGCVFLSFTLLCI